jgi:hypothetical protein
VVDKNGESEYFSDSLLFISLQREEKGKVTDWIKGVFTLVRAFNGLHIYGVDCFLVLF